jgi:hypothetical protein
VPFFKIGVKALPRPASDQCFSRWRNTDPPAERLSGAGQAEVGDDIAPSVWDDIVRQPPRKICGFGGAGTPCAVEKSPGNTAHNGSRF